MYVLISDIDCAFYPRLELALWDHAQNWWEAIDTENVFTGVLEKYCDNDGEPKSWKEVFRFLNPEELFHFYELTKGDEMYGPVIKKVFTGEVVSKENLTLNEVTHLKTTDIDCSYRSFEHKISL